MIDRPHQGTEFVIDNLDDLFFRPNALNDSLADCPFAYPFDERIRDVEINVSIEQCLANRDQTFLDVGSAELATPGNRLEGTGKTFLQTIEHVDYPKMAPVIVSPL